MEYNLRYYSRKSDLNFVYILGFENKQELRIC